MSNQALIGFEPHSFNHMLAMKRVVGEPLLYYVGDLAGDCTQFVDEEPTDTCKRARFMRTAAWAEYEVGRCHLLQRKLCTNTYEYWAYPGKNVVSPLCNEDLRANYSARMARGGICTPALKRGGIPYARA